MTFQILIYGVPCDDLTLSLALAKLKQQSASSEKGVSHAATRLALLRNSRRDGQCLVSLCGYGIFKLVHDWIIIINNYIFSADGFGKSQEVT